MGVSIYFTARRKTPLTENERTYVDYAFEQFEEIRPNPEVPQESATYYDRTDPSKPDVIFEGSCLLPDHSTAAAHQAVIWWCGLLSVVRNKLTGAEWDVNVEGAEIVWDTEKQEYDPDQ